MKDITFIITQETGAQLPTLNCLFFLFFPYIEYFHFERDSLNFELRAKYKEINLKIKRIFDEDGLKEFDLNTTFIITNYGFNQPYKKKFKTVDLQVSGEYGSDNLDLINKYLDSGNKIITSEIPSVIFDLQDKNLLDYIHHYNRIQSSFCSLLLIPSIIGYHITFIDEYKTTNKHKYDVFCYFKDNYKSWRSRVINKIKNKNLNLKIKSDLLSPSDTAFTFKKGDSDLVKYYNTFNWEHIHTNFFYDTFDSKVILNFETDIDGEFLYLTEKSIKNLQYGLPFYNVCSLTTTLELKKLGFYSFDMEYIDLFKDKNGLFIKDEYFTTNQIIKNCENFFEIFKENEEFIQNKLHLFKHNQILYKKLVLDDNLFRRELLDKLFNLN